MKNLLLVIALAAGAGLAGTAFIGGLVTGSIDGLAKGRDLVTLATSPVAFFALLGLYLVLAVGLAVYAYSIAKRGPAA